MSLITIIGSLNSVVQCLSTKLHKGLIVYQTELNNTCKKHPNFMADNISSYFKMMRFM